MSDSDTADTADRRESEDWWRSSIIEMAPGVIRYRGYPVEELIAHRVGLAQMIWLMTRGELPTKAQAALLEAALMSAVDHGPQAPSIAIARMAATCGVGRDIRVVRTGFKLNGEAPSVQTPPPLLGQHSDEILAELGYSAEDVEAMKAEKAV